jgi:hypothetical protein
MLRKLLKEEIEIVRKGGEPMESSAIRPETRPSNSTNLDNEMIRLYRYAAESSPTPLRPLEP